MYMNLQGRREENVKKILGKLSTATIFVIGFFLIITLSAVVLSLPVSSRTGEATPFFSSLFTAVSSTCITGLVVYDTFTHWSAFGQAVILMLIQLGGLGFMSVATVFSLLFRRAMGYKERMMLVQNFNLSDMSGVVKIVKHIIIGTFSFEGAAAVILAVRFIPEYGFASGIWRGVFISISAFCNAGFDLMGSHGEYSSLTPYADDLVVNLTVCALIIIGGLGFLVWEEIFEGKPFSKLSVQSRIVLVFSGALIIGGAVMFFIFEYSNPATLGALSPKGKVLASFFQAITPRTAGFNTVNLSELTESSKIIMIILMFIGGSSGSTAGGIKTNTIAVLFFAAMSVLRGQKDVVVMKRRISQETILRAFALVFMAILLLLVFSFAISVIDGIPFISSLFECVSAFCTVGLSIGATARLSFVSLSMLMILMFLGRVGLLTASFVLFRNQQGADSSVSYPEAKITIG